MANKKGARSSEVLASSNGSAQTALELLETWRQKHATSVKMLTGQLRGVERALDMAKAKLSAIEEVIEAIAPNGALTCEGDGHE